MFFFWPTFIVRYFSFDNSLRSFDSFLNTSPPLGNIEPNTELSKNVFFLFADENLSSSFVVSSKGVSFIGFEMVLRDPRLISGSFCISYFLLILLNLLGM